jgi:hypothetical protein
LLDLGTPRAVNEVKLYLLDDGEGQPIAAPAEYKLEYATGQDPWKPVPGQARTPAKPTGHMPNMIRFPEIKIEKLRVSLVNAPGRKSGMTEIEAWGPDVRPYVPARPPAGNLAFNPNPKDKDSYPKASASFSGKTGDNPENAIDGKIGHRSRPMTRWTCQGSPNTSDWLEVDFGAKKQVGRLLLYIFSDGGGVREPKGYVAEGWTGTEWKAIPSQSTNPEKPAAHMINTVTFPPISTSKIRVVFTHNGEGDSRTGINELEIWEK